MERMRQREWERGSELRWLAGALVAAVAFGVITWLVLDGTLNSVDGRDETWISGHRVGALTTLLKAFAALGSWPALLVFSAVAGLAFFWRFRDWRPGGCMGSALLGAVVLSRLFAWAADRPPPPASLAAAAVRGGSSYPSGQVTEVTAVIAVFALILASDRSPRAQAAIGWISGLFILVAGAARVYLGVHWLSDGVGGFALGLAWMASMVVVGGRGLFRPREERVRIGWYRQGRGP